MSLIQIKEPGQNLNNKELCVGIDFGTTNCVCSIKEKNSVSFIRDEFDKVLIPSVVSSHKNNLLVGNQVFNDPSSKVSDKIFSVKRLLTDEPNLNKIQNKDSKIQKSPVEISTIIFKYLKKCCELFLKSSVKKCVITVPAYFGDRSRSSIRKAATLAGLDVVRLINEPTAAAYAFGLENKAKGNYFVYDLGGGTFDVSILKLTDNVFKVIATGGDSNLGGDDIDINLAKDILREFYNKNFNDIEPSLRQIIIKKTQKIKESLCDKKEIFLKNFLPNIDKSMTITKDFLNSSIEDLIDKTFEISKNVLNDSKINIGEFDGFIFVGGSTRLNIIRTKVNQIFKLKIFSNMNPDLIVSQGAALHADALINGSDSLLLDVTPLSLGIETAGGLMEKIINRNSNIPIYKEQEFTTYENGQTAIKIHILQGERETVKHNRSLGEFVLSNLSPKPSGIPRIIVNFSVDSDGILSVSAYDKNSNEKNSIEIKPVDGLDIDDMNRMIKDSIIHAKEDLENRSINEAIMDAKRFLNELDGLKEEMNLLCNLTELKEINVIKSQLIMEIKSKNKDRIRSCIKKLDNSTKKLAERRIQKNLTSSLQGEEIDKL